MYITILVSTKVSPLLFSVPFPFSSGNGSSKWPIHCYAPLDINVNSYAGGCAGLLQLSCSYGGPGADTTAELGLLRLGYDSNNFQFTSIAKSNHGHFGCENSFVTDEHGRFIPDLMFGRNDVSLFSTDHRHGNMSHGRVYRGDDIESIPLNINDGNSGGNTLILCQGVASGVGDSTMLAGVYMVRLGFKENHAQSVHVAGTNAWKFDGNESGHLNVSTL